MVPPLTVLVLGQIGHRGVVGHVEIIGLGGELRSERVDLLHLGHDAETLSIRTNLVLVRTDKLPDLIIGETSLLRSLHKGKLHSGESACTLQISFDHLDVLELVEEPLIDLGQIVQLIDGVALIERVRL